MLEEHSSPDFKEKCKNTGRLQLKIACRFPGDTYHSHLCMDLAPAHRSALLLCLQLPMLHKSAFF